jgi:hypothetical protein
MKLKINKKCTKRLRKKNEEQSEKTTYNKLGLNGEIIYKKSKLYKKAWDTKLRIKITNTKFEEKQLSGCSKTLGG